MTDEHWAKIVKAIGHKVIEAGPSRFQSASHVDLMMSIMRENWDLLGKESQLDKYLATKELATKQAERQAKAAELSHLDSEIERLTR